MPQGSRKFGCGELATGFRPAGLPPSFYVPNRVIPTGGGGGTNPGTGTEPETEWECKTTYTGCPTGQTCDPEIYPQGCIAKSVCIEIPKGTCSQGKTCWPTEPECRATIGTTGCPEYDACETPPQPTWKCIETKISCAEEGWPDDYRYERKCVQCGPGENCAYISQAECLQGCVSIPCPGDRPPSLDTGDVPLTGGIKAHSACVEEDKEECLLPGSTTSTQIYSQKRTCEPCTNCRRRPFPNQHIIDCDPPAGTTVGPCVPSTTCGQWCTSDVCPTTYNKARCRTLSVTTCPEPYAEQVEIIETCDPCECYWHGEEKCFANTGGGFNISDDCPLTKCVTSFGYPACPSIYCPDDPLKPQARRPPPEEEGEPPLTPKGVSKEQLQRQVIAPTDLGVRKSKSLNVTELVVSYTEEYLNFDSNTVYDPTFNFSLEGVSTPEESPSLLSNSRYPGILGSMISPVIEYFIRSADTGAGWTETKVNELLNDRSFKSIKESLNPNLDFIFNNLTYSTGVKIDPKLFYSAITKLILTGKLDEFDSNYYFNLYHYQQDHEIVNYEASHNTSLNDNVALGIIADSIISADPDQHTETDDIGIGIKDSIMNTKVYLTDVSAAIPIITPSEESSDVDSTSLLLARDDGVLMTLSDGSDVLLEPGPYHGYYIPVDIIEGDSVTSIPLEFETQLADAYLTPIEALHKATILMGEDTFMSLNVSSIAGKGEFDSSYSSSFSTNVMYFAVDLKNMKDDEGFSNSNTLIHKMVIPYKQMTDPGEIELNSIEAGTSVTEVFLHYEDPIRSYLTDSSSCELNLMNIDFTSFIDNKAPFRGEIITRGIAPRVLVFVFGSGSKHNPFHATSKINSIFTDDDGGQRIHRACDLVPYMHPSITGGGNHVLKQQYTFTTSGTYGLGPVGTQKANFDQDRTFFVYDPGDKYDSVFFSEGIYTSTEPAIAVPATRRLIKEIINDVLITNYEFTHFTWWDLFRRLKLNEYADLRLEMTHEVSRMLEKGDLSNGTPIRKILVKESETGITSELLESDTIILSKEERQGFVD